MRVSLPICFASSLLVVGLTWWLGIRSKDFMSPPSEAELEKVRLSAAQINPTALGLGDALSPHGQQNRDSKPIPVILPHHVNRAPALDDYLDEAKHGADYLAELADLLKKDHPERSLICWERVIDSCKAGENQASRAAAMVARLKKSTPMWNPDASTGIPILIQAGTGPSAAAIIQPVLDEIADQLESFSGGIIRVQTKVSVGSEDMVEAGQSPVALWISGPEESSGSTDVVSFFIPIDGVAGMEERMMREIYRIVRHHLSKHSTLNPPPKLEPDSSAPRHLEARITRFGWQKFAQSLQNSP